MYAQLIIASYINAVGIEVIVREGLNTKNAWELRLVIPMCLWALYDASHKGMVYEQREELYYASNPSGVVSYFCYSGPSYGFSGSTYNLTMVDGTTQQLKGPWSSRAECMNEAGFEPCMEVNIECMYNMASNMTMKEINRMLLPLDMECILIENRCHIIRL